MSETTDRTSCISHRALVHYFVMYEDFLEVAKVSEHQYKLAAFWRVLETKTNDRITYNEGAKEKGQPVLDLWIEIPYSEFVKRSLGVYKESSFQIAAAESERLGFSKSRVGNRPRNPLDPNSPKDDYKEYLLITGTLQKAINTGEYPTPIEINSPLLKSISARKEAKKKKKAIENNTTGIENNSPPVENNTGAIEINRNNNITESSNISKIEITSDDVAFAPHHDTPTSFSSEPSQPSPVSAASGVHLDNPPTAQPMDDTSSQARDNDGREAPVPLQAKSDTDLPASNVEPLTAFTDASHNEVPPPQGSRIASETPTPNDVQIDTTLLRSGENATVSDGVPEQSATEQPTLLERPKVPEMPPVTMKLSGEKIVQITEAFIGKYYPETRRQKQIAAARRIIAEGVTEEQYITAYVDMVDWWKQNQGVFHVFDMAANTKRGQLRVLDILERIEARQKPPVNLEERRNGLRNGASESQEPLKQAVGGTRIDHRSNPWS